MKANTKNRNHNAHHRNAHHYTLDLFSTPSDSPAAPDAAAPDAAPRGDGAQPAAKPEAGGHLVAPETPMGGVPELPALEDVVVRRAEPFKVPGLKSLVLPVPVFRVKLVRERDHLTRQVTTPADAARLCSELLDGADREVFLVIALSTANRIIGAHVAHVGTVDASIASPRDVYKYALLCNARSVLVAHNHPSGNLEPSKADVAVSKQMQAAGEALSIRLLDSLIIGFDGRYTSLSERGLL